MKNKDPAIIQAMADEAVWYHGTDPLNWPEPAYKKLTSAGITISDLTPEVLETAYKNARASMERRCKEHKHSPEKPFPTLWEGESQPPEVPPVEKTTRERAKANLRLLREQPGLYNRGRQGEEGPEEEENATMLQVQESAFRKMLLLMGIDNADDAEKWSLSRINKKLSDYGSFKSLTDAPNVGAPPEGSEAQKLMRSICDALKYAPASVKVVPDRTEEGEGENVTEDNGDERGTGAARKSAAKRGVSTSMPTTTVAKKPAKKPAAEKDDFGCRVGTNAAAVNACLTGDFKRKTDLAKEAGLPSAAFVSHLERLIEKGHPIEKGEEGFRRTDMKPSVRKKPGPKPAPKDEGEDE